MERAGVTGILWSIPLDILGRVESKYTAVQVKR